VLTRLAGLLLGFLFAGAFYLLLIDTLDLPELYAGAAAALIAALGLEAARQQHFAEVSATPVAVARSWRAVARVPADIARVSCVIVQQLVRPHDERGRLRAVPFRFGRADDSRDAGRRALAEAAGSLAPNTIIVGVDPQRSLLLAHQLYRSGGREAIDVLELG
jgi:hypothetical protein